MFSTLVSGLG